MICFLRACGWGYLLAAVLSFVIVAPQHDNQALLSFWQVMVFIGLVIVTR